MFEWWLLCLILQWLVCAEAADPLLGLNAKDFQLEFLRELTVLAEQRAEESLNGYLAQLERDAQYANYTGELSAARATAKLQYKVTLIKQLLDAKPHQEADLEHTTVLRNLVFLNRLKATLRATRDASTQEIRQLRLHRLCQQFEHPAAPRRPSLINGQTVGAAVERLNLTRSEKSANSLDLNQFGAQLYERVKQSGAEIIDNYLQILRGLLQDIIDGDHADLAESSSRLDNMLLQLDAMLATQDFFEKRQKVYAYLERHLSTDYEQMRDSAGAEQHLTEQLLAQLKAKGLTFS